MDAYKPPFLLTGYFCQKNEFLQKYGVYIRYLCKLRGESHKSQGARGWGAINNDVLKFRKVIEFESSCILLCFSYI